MVPLTNECSVLRCHNYLQTWNSKMYRQIIKENDI